MAESERAIWVREPRPARWTLRSRVSAARDAILRSLDQIDRRLRRGSLTVFYDRSYWLPLPSLDSTPGIDLRRAAHVVWCLGDYRVARGNQLRHPRPASYSELSLVHTAEYLESLSDAETLARIFAVDPS